MASEKKDIGKNGAKKPAPKFAPPKGPKMPLPPPVLKLSLTQQAVIPKPWPALNSPSMGLLSQAIQFVADGKPVPAGFLEELKRMLTSLEEKAELVQVLFQHHQMHRLQKLHSALEQVEAIILNPKQIAAYEPDQQLKLMQVIYSEVASINKHLAEEHNVPSADNMNSAVDPTKLEAVEEARKIVGAMPAQMRRALRDSLIKNLQPVIESAKALPAAPDPATPPAKPPKK